MRIIKFNSTTQTTKIQDPAWAWISSNLYYIIPGCIGLLAALITAYLAFAYGDLGGRGFVSVLAISGCSLLIGCGIAVAVFLATIVTYDGLGADLFWIETLQDWIDKKTVQWKVEYLIPAKTMAMV